MHHPRQSVVDFSLSWPGMYSDLERGSAWMVSPEMKKKILVNWDHKDMVLPKSWDNNNKQELLLLARLITLCHSHHGYFPILSLVLNTLRPRQNGRRFADGTFKQIFFNVNVLILIQISLKFIPMGPINNITALVQIMAWRRPGDKPLFEPMMVQLLMPL